MIAIIKGNKQEFRVYGICPECQMAVGRTIGAGSNQIIKYQISALNITTEDITETILCQTCVEKTRKVA